MPWNKALYPKSWEEIATRIKAQSGWCCEECGKSCRKPKESIENFIKRAYPYSTTEKFLITANPQKYTLTVAHLNHVPGDCSMDNLRALCAPCHCRYDLSQMATKKKLKAEREGQLSLM